MSYSQRIYIGPYLVGKAKNRDFNPWDAFDVPEVFNEDFAFVNGDDYSTDLHYFAVQKENESFVIGLDFKSVDVGWQDKEEEFYKARHDTQKSVKVLEPHYEKLEWKYGVLIYWS